MKELSLNILDISENSVKAGASLVKILLSETEDKLEIRIEDDGVGMTAEVVRLVDQGLERGRRLGQRYRPQGHRHRAGQR